MNKPRYSKGIFVTHIVITIYRDTFTDASNDELSLYIIAGMLAVIAFKYVFESDSRTNHTRSN